MNDIEPGSPLRIANKLFVLFRLVSHLTQLTIDLRANQNYEARDVQPEHENHECPQRTVGGVVRSQVADVKVERQRGRSPGHDDENTPQRVIWKATLFILDL